MASQRHILEFILTVSLALSASSQPHHFSKISSSENDNLVDVSLYYESLCPYCATFIVNNLVKIFQTDLISIVNLRLIPWGNTQVQPNNTWICQHGVDECQLDVTEACAINTWPKVETHFRFIYCVERLHLMNKHTQWESCFSAIGLDSKPLNDCYNNGLGFQLENSYAEETANLNPRHRFVPWVVVNNFPLQEDFQNFISYICRAYRGNKVPNACKSRLFEINLSKAATSIPQVCTPEIRT
ncbi:hypothetical protein ACS0TY_016184 [Phlomoides rotata]